MKNSTTSRGRRLRLELLEERRLLATLPNGFSETVVASDLTSPITMDIEPNGRIWLAYQDGRIEVIENDSLLPTPAIHLDADGSGERGLQGIELDPDFSANGYIYVYYTAASPASHNRVSRLTVDPTTENTILPGSEVILLDLPDLSTVNNPIWHMGGAIHFMSDGTLAVQVGDHQAGVVAQNLESPFGKVLRINPANGAAASDNPFYDAADGISWRDYIWASGLRNPYSGDIDPVTGRFFIGDVGQGSWEEINDATAGARNFGWPATEGSFNQATFPNFTNPFYAYSHANGQCAITGGAFYRPAFSQFPAEYHGKFFFSEFCGGDIWVIDPDNPSGVELFASDTPYPMNIEFAADGSMYYVERGAGAGGNPGIGTGKIIKVQFAAEIPPQIVNHPVDRLVSVGQDASFSVSAAGTPPIAYQWQRHNGSQFVDIPGATSRTLTLNDVTLTDDGAQLRVVVSNSFGSALSGIANLDVTTDTPPTPVIDFPGDGATYRAGDVIEFSGGAFDLEDGQLPGTSLTWQVDFHHASHLHPFMAPTTGITGGQIVIPTNSETAHDVWYRIRLIATDSAGLTSETYRDILPVKSDFVVTNNLGGGQVLVDGQTKFAPHSETGVVNVTRSLTAPQSQIVEGQAGAFLQWLDGVTSPTRVIATPEEDTAFIAIYGDTSSTVTFLSDLDPSYAYNGWGPFERDASNGEANAGDGDVITLNGVRYRKGLGVHAEVPSVALAELRYDLGGAYRRFISDVGIDDEVTNPAASIEFRVYGDGVLLFDSGVMHFDSPTQTLDVDVTGVNELRLVLGDGGDGVGFDHGDWADARLIADQSASDIRINFQLDAAPQLAGYLKDAGHTFADRGNGFSYGWSSDHTDLSRDRDVNVDQRFDTLLHFHVGQEWEIAVPNGAYAVTVTIGDAGNVSTHTLNVEGREFWNGLRLQPNEFAKQTQVVTVSDGRITLDQGSAEEKATRLNFIEIIPLGSDIGVLPLTSADVTLDGKLTYRDVLAFAEGWGPHPENASLEELARGGDLNFDRVTDGADWALFHTAWLEGGMPPLDLDSVLDPQAGDFNRDGAVSDQDYLLWKSTFGSTRELSADGNGNGVIDASDYTTWRDAKTAIGASTEQSLDGGTSISVRSALKDREDQSSARTLSIELAFEMMSSDTNRARNGAAREARAESMVLGRTDDLALLVLEQAAPRSPSGEIGRWRAIDVVHESRAALEPAADDLAALLAFDEIDPGVN